MEINKLLEIAIRASLDAGEEIISVYHKTNDVELKEDKSPLTIADRLSHKKILEYLSLTNIPVLSEEGKAIDYDERKKWNLFWMVDPLDGTKEFIKKNDEFTVNIALIENGIPVAGVVYAPVLRDLYFASKESGSYKINISSDSPLRHEKVSVEKLVSLSQRLPVLNDSNTFTVVASRSHMTPETEVFINNLKEKHGELNFISKGSSLKICLVAEGTAEIYPRLAPTMEWDTAAGQAIAMYADKSVVLYKNNKPMSYNKPDLLNEWFVVQ